MGQMVDLVTEHSVIPMWDLQVQLIPEMVSKKSSIIQVKRLRMAVARVKSLSGCGVVRL